MKALIDDILDEIRTDMAATDWQELTDDGLYAGKLGLVYFYHILYKESGDPLYKEKIEDILSYVLQQMGQHQSSILLRSSLMTGLTGFGYMVKLLVDEGLLDENFLEELDSINDLSLNECLLLIENKNFDFFNGSIGILFYFVTIGHQENITLIVDKLYKEFVLNDRTFYNEAGYLEGIHLGYAHGLPAIIKTLDGISGNKKSEEIILHLLGELSKLIGSSNVILADCRYYLPRSIHRDMAHQYDLNWRPVLAWSNSDLNYSTLIYSIERSRLDSSFLDLAAELARGTVDRRHESQTRIWDYRFNFGSAGVAQLYLKIYKETGDPKIYEAYQFWIKESIRLYRESGRIKEHKLNFIDNLPGLYLVLLEYNNPAIAGWDKILLL